jgi:hypothetical protein
MKIFKIVIFLVIIAIIGSLPFLQVKTVLTDVQDASLKLFFDEQLLGKNWVLTSLSKFESLAKEHHLIRSVTITRDGFLALRVEGVIREAFAAVRSGGFYIMIDVEGTVLELSESAKAPYAIEGFHVQSAKIGYPIVTDDLGLIEKAVQLVYLYQMHSTITPDVHLIDNQLIQKIHDRLWVNFGIGYDILEQFNQSMAIYEDMTNKSSTTGIINVAIQGQTVIQSWKD